MNKKKNKDELTAIENPKKINAVPGVVLFATLCVLAFVFLIIVLYKNDMITLPSFIERLFVDSRSGEDSDPDDFHAAFIASANKGEPERESGEVFTLNKEQLTQTIEETEFPANYLHEVIIAYYYGENDRTQTARIFKYKDKYRIRINTSDGIEKNVVYDGRRILIQNTRNNQITEKVLGVSEAAGFSIYSETGIPDLSDLFRMLDEADETGGADSVISDYEINLIRNANGNIVKITFRYTDLKISEVYEISLESGIITNAESYIDDKLYYRMTTTAFNESYYSDESMFEINVME